MLNQEGYDLMGAAFEVYNEWEWKRFILSDMQEGRNVEH